jgi:hypothetical protein
MTDRLSLANALAEAKIERSAAERIATEIFDAIHDNVATKQDLDHIEAALRADIQRLEAATKADLDRLQAAMRELELRLEARIDRVVVRLGSLIVILTGIILAAIRYLPPAH